MGPRSREARDTGIGHALRETGALLAVQPWVQGTDSRFRPDFMVFYDGGTVVVELDGHETHKTREQRTRDARRQRLV